MWSKLNNATSSTTLRPWLELDIGVKVELGLQGLSFLKSLLT